MSSHVSACLIEATSDVTRVVGAVNAAVVSVVKKASYVAFRSPDFF